MFSKEFDVSIAFKAFFCGFIETTGFEMKLPKITKIL